MTERIDQVSQVVVGQYYLVPTVRARWSTYEARDWAVIGPKHNDRHCFNFEYDHYHLDSRFFPFEYGVSHHTEDGSWLWRAVASSPLMTSSRINPDGLPAVVWRRRKCRRLKNPEQDFIASGRGKLNALDCLDKEFAGRQARHDGRGWVCPHRKVSLAGQPVDDGIIVCPLHFLRIDAKTGLVLGGEVGR